MPTVLVKKQIPARIDAEIIEALRVASEETGLSIAKYLENLLVINLKSAGHLQMDFTPSKANWGGPRKKKSSGQDSI
jgi:hypothetical protein